DGDAPGAQLQGAVDTVAGEQVRAGETEVDHRRVEAPVGDEPQLATSPGTRAGHPYRLRQAGAEGTHAAAGEDVLGEGAAQRRVRQRADVADPAGAERVRDRRGVAAEVRVVVVGERLRALELQLVHPPLGRRVGAEGEAVGTDGHRSGEVGVRPVA